MGYIVEEEGWRRLTSMCECIYPHPPPSRLLRLPMRMCPAWGEAWERGASADNLKTFFSFCRPFYFPPAFFFSLSLLPSRERVSCVCVGGSTRLPTRQQTCSRHCSVHEPRPLCRVSSLSLWIFFFFFFLPVCVCVCFVFLVHHQLTREGLTLVLSPLLYIPSPFVLCYETLRINSPKVPKRTLSSFVVG